MVQVIRLTIAVVSSNLVLSKFTGFGIIRSSTVRHRFIRGAQPLLWVAVFVALSPSLGLRYIVMKVIPSQAARLLQWYTQ
jgi:hypothetical protein